MHCIFFYICDLNSTNGVIAQLLNIIKFKSSVLTSSIGFFAASSSCLRSPSSGISCISMAPLFCFSNFRFAGKGFQTHLLNQRWSYVTFCHAVTNTDEMGQYLSLKKLNSQIVCIFKFISHKSLILIYKKK